MTKYKELDIKWIPSPIKIFSLIWISIIILFQMRLSLLTDGMTLRFTIIFSANLAFLIAGYYFGYWMPSIIKVKKKDQSFINICKLTRFNKILTSSWIIITIIEIYWSGGVTVFWYLLGIDKTYFDYGIKGIHGFVNSIYWVICANTTLLYILTKSKSKLYSLLVLMMWPIVVISRQMLVIALLQTIVMFILFNKPNMKTFKNVMIVCIILTLIFGWVGDFRTGYDVFHELAQPAYDFLDYMPSGVLWVIIYAVTPIANIQYIMENTEPSYSFDNTVGTLLPSPIRSALGFNTGPENEELITPAFNACTYMYEFYKDFGFSFVFIATSFIGFLSGIITMLLRRNVTYARILIYCILVQMLVLSIFWNHFIYLPVCFQPVIVIIGSFFMNCKINQDGFF